LAPPSRRNEAGFGRRIAGALTALCLCSCGNPAPPERIVLIVIDTLRRDFLTCYANALLPTPHIDALARQGRAYESVSAAYHQTSMSMAALFTGRTPSIERPEGHPPLPWTGQTWCGMARFAEPGEELCIPKGLTTLAERLRGAGYWTIGVMSNPMLFEPSGFGRGFDDRSEVGRRPPEVGPLARYRAEEAWRERTWRHVNRAARRALARRAGDRFFLYVHYMDVHDWGYRGAPYAQSVAMVDTAVGALLGVLDAADLLEDAAVILTSDHGEHLGETHPPDPARVMRSHQGNPSYQELLHVPLIVTRCAPRISTPRSCASRASRRRHPTWPTASSSWASSASSPIAGAASRARSSDAAGARSSSTCWRTRESNTTWPGPDPTSSRSTAGRSWSCSAGWGARRLWETRSPTKIGAASTRSDTSNRMREPWRSTFCSCWWGSRSSWPAVRRSYAAPRGWPGRWASRR
jgi:hypothetical protein